MCLPFSCLQGERWERVGQCLRGLVQVNTNVAGGSGRFRVLCAELLRVASLPGIPPSIRTGLAVSFIDSYASRTN